MPLQLDIDNISHLYTVIRLPKQNPSLPLKRPKVLRGLETIYSLIYNPIIYHIDFYYSRLYNGLCL